MRKAEGGTFLFILHPHLRQGVTNQVSLISSSLMFEPTSYMLPRRVVVRPVDHAALFVPHVFAVEAHTIAFLQPGDPRCDVDVVRNEERLT